LIPHAVSRPLGALLRRFRRDRRGVAALETALAVSLVVLPLCAGLVVAGQALQLQYRLTRAMHAGFIYAWRNPTASNTAIQSAVQAAIPTLTLYSNAASNLCFCIPPNGTIIQSNGSFACGTQTCSNGTVLSVWVSIVVGGTYSPLFPFPGLPTSVQSGGTVRLQ
jgi:Flp pilus assembly protein TadG